MVNRQLIFIVVGVADVIIAVFFVFVFGYLGTVKVDDEVKATLTELDNSTSNFIVREIF